MPTLKKLLSDLRSTCNQFTEEAHQRKMDLLDRLSELKKFNVNELNFYHDCLLFLMAYPQNKELYNMAGLELQRLPAIAAKLSESKNAREQMAMNGTGIENSYIIASFSYDICRWLIEKYPDNVQYFSCDADEQTQQSVLKKILPAALTYCFDKDYKGFAKWKNSFAIGNDATGIKRILDLFSESVNDASVRDELFDSMRFFIQINVAAPLFSRTTNRTQANHLFFHKGDLIRKAELIKILSQPVNQPLQISEHEKIHLVDSSKCALMMLLRETDPVTYAQVNETEWHQLDRGISIALYYMEPSRRMPLDAYVGYMAYKNGCPIAYGGAWIFMDHARIGVNVFEPYRGGESAFIFGQILRLYAQRFNLKQFEAEPYQIGHNNVEGIKSGAFWFYYRLGFRPQQNHLLKIADEEWNRIISDKNYRSSTVCLKKLALSFMVLKLDSAVSIIELNALSVKANEWTSKNLNGNVASLKSLIEKAAKGIFKNYNIKSLSPLQKEVMHNILALLLPFVENIKWDKKSTDLLMKAIIEKASGSEFKYLKALNENKALRQILTSDH